MTIEVKTVKASMSAEEIDQYWTPERIKAAKSLPYEPSQAPQEDKKDESPKTKGKGEGKSGQSTIKHHKSNSGTVKTPGSGETDPQPVANPQAYPWCCVGKLYFTLNGEDRDATAAVFGKNVILTAAHCIYDVGQGAWANNIIFIPAYDNGNEPFGRWAYVACTVPVSWDGLGAAFDFATVELAQGGNDIESIGDDVGYLGYITQLDVRQTWIDVGYPTAISEGGVMTQEAGDFTRTQEGGAIVGKQGTMTYGASGGPWLLEYDMSLRINGVHSCGDVNFPDEVFSAYFGEYAVEFLQDTDC